MSKTEILWAVFLTTCTSGLSLFGIVVGWWIKEIFRRLDALKSSLDKVLDQHRQLEKEVQVDHGSTLKILAQQLVQAASDVGELRRLKPDVDALHQKLRELSARGRN